MMSSMMPGELACFSVKFFARLVLLQVFCLRILAAVEAMESKQSHLRV